jgi:hypothetical protein
VVLPLLGENCAKKTIFENFDESVRKKNKNKNKKKTTKKSEKTKVVL